MIHDDDDEGDAGGEEGQPNILVVLLMFVFRWELVSGERERG